MNNFYRLRSEPIYRAAQLTEDNADEVAEWVGGTVFENVSGELNLEVNDPYSMQVVLLGEWIVDYGDGEFGVFHDQRFNEMFRWYDGEDA